MRPEGFRLNADSTQAAGLVFAGLGQHVFGKHYHDSTEQLGFAGNHGTLSATMDPATDWVWDAELGRWACDFTATNSECVDGAEQAFPNTEDFSVSCWVNARTWINNSYPVAKGAAAAYSEFAFWVQSSGPAINVLIGKDASSWLITTAVRDVGMTTSKWYHYVATKQGVACKLYRNGVLVDSTDASQSARYLDTRSVSIGRGSGIGGIPVGYFDGHVSDVLVHNRALTPSEIEQLANPDPMIRGLLLPPTRRLWPVATISTPATNRRRRLLLGVSA